MQEETDDYEKMDVLEMKNKDISDNKDFKIKEFKWQTKFSTGHK